MRLFLLCLLLLSAACSPDGTPNAKVQKTIDVLCDGDALGQPVVVKAVPVMVPQASSAVTVDELLVHPAVVAACAAYHSKPKAVSSASTPDASPPKP